MRCPECNHPCISIKVDENQQLRIQCFNCEADTIIEDSPASSFLLFNYDLEKAKAEGKIAFLGGKNIEENPYDDQNSKSALSREWWKRGWESERESMEIAGNFLSAEKEKEEDGKLQREKIASLNEKLKEEKGLLKNMNELRQDIRVALALILAAKYYRRKTYRIKITEILEKEQQKYSKLVAINSYTDWEKDILIV